MTFTPEEYQQYSRHILLPQVGEEGQAKLKKASVLIIGAGGLGVPVIQYLAAAGIGKLMIIDGDFVEQNNLQRQVLYTQSEIGLNKAEVAAKKMAQLNPFVEIKPLPYFITKDKIVQIISEVDIVIDGSDNFYTRYLVNDTCVELQKPLIYGSINQFEGQVSVFNIKKKEGFSPNLRDLFPSPPPPDLVPDCSVAGVLGVLPGIIGSIMACEALKCLLQIGDLLSSKLLVFNALKMNFDFLEFEKGNDVNTKNMPQEFCGIIQSIKPSEFQTLNREDYLLIDVRNYDEYSKFNIGGINIPLPEIESWATTNFPEKNVILVCQSGIRSRKAAELLLNKGITAFNLINGLDSLEPNS